MLENFLKTVQGAKSGKRAQTKTAQRPTRLKIPRSIQKVNLLSPSNSNYKNKAIKAFKTTNREDTLAMVTAEEVETVDVV